jgi:hypothetical protein
MPEPANVIFVTLQTEDTALKSLLKRIEKLTLIHLWIIKASALYERYLRMSLAEISVRADLEWSCVG